MPNNDILSEFSQSDISHFRKDFTQMIRVGAEIDRYYGEAKHDLDSIIPKYEKLVAQFNKKYSGIKIKTAKTIDSFSVKLFVKERGIKDFFANSASRISGLKAVGRSGFSQIEVADAEKFARFLDLPLDKVYLSYTDAESGTSTVAAELDRKEKMVELAYSPAEFMSGSSACFKICAFYALKEGFNRKIDVYGDASAFGFSNLLDEMENREWYDHFNPRFLE